MKTNTRKDEDALEYFERILKDPKYMALGQTFIRNVEYAIILVKEHRAKQDQLINTPL